MQERDEYIAELYASGCGIENIMRQLNIESRGAIYKALDRQGVKLRPAKGTKESQGLKFDENANNKELLKAIIERLGCKHYRMEV